MNKLCVRDNLCKKILETYKLGIFSHSKKLSGISGDIKIIVPTLAKRKKAKGIFGYILIIFFPLCLAKLHNSPSILINHKSIFYCS